jgi:hypothetical protein
VSLSIFALNVILTFGVFSAVCWRLQLTRHPTACLRDRGQWALWGAVHIGIAYTMLAVLFDSLDGAVPDTGHHVLVGKACLILLFLVPWRRRMGDRV